MTIGGLLIISDGHVLRLMPRGRTRGRQRNHEWYGTMCVHDVPESYERPGATVRRGGCGWWSTEGVDLKSKQPREWSGVLALTAHTSEDLSLSQGDI